MITAAGPTSRGSWFWPGVSARNIGNSVVRAPSTAPDSFSNSYLQMKVIRIYTTECVNGRLNDDNDMETHTNG